MSRQSNYRGAEESTLVSNRSVSMVSEGCEALLTFCCEYELGIYNAVVLGGG